LLQEIEQQKSKPVSDNI